MTTRRRISALLLAATVFFILLFSSVFPSVHFHHPCTHHHCPICEQILRCDQLVSSLEDVTFFVTVCFLPGISLFFCPPVFTGAKRMKSLVTLKVKLTH